MWFENITRKIAEKENSNKFRFAIITDPQIYPANPTGGTAKLSQESLKEAIRKINEADPRPDFVCFLGDIINSPDQKSYDNFENCVKDLIPDAIFVHGNHDTSAPFEKHKKIVKKLSGVDDMYYSFDAGYWHFAVLPCVEGSSPLENQIKEDMLNWLEKDLEQNKDKNTIMFVHMHGMPQGTTQTEWYCYPLAIRKRIESIISKHGNVKYYFNGHIHNVLKASVKNLRKYNGITYVSVPSITQGRPYNEEFEGFDKDVGGYYLIVDVDGDQLTIRGYQAFKDAEIIYPLRDEDGNDIVPEFTNELEPRWFNVISDIPANPKLINGGFEEGEDGLLGWYKKYRYITDVNPQYVQETVEDIFYTGKRAARLYNRAVYPDFWANDENCEIYQFVNFSPESRPALNLKYFLKNTPVNGGGFVRLMAFNDEGFQFMMMFKWGVNEEACDFLPRCFGYELYGTHQHWAFIHNLGTAYKAMFYDICKEPEKWHNLSVDISALYDDARKEKSAYSKLGITKIMVGLGSWVNREVDEDPIKCSSEVFFDDVVLADISKTDVNPGDYSNNGVQFVNDGSQFYCVYGKRLGDAEVHFKKRAASCRKDNHPPLPVVAAWEEKPRAIGNSVVMKAAEAIDPYGVEYFFEESVDGVVTDSSGWQESREYIFHGRKNGFKYSYRVRTRDKWHIPAPEPIPDHNVGEWSTAESVVIE